MPPFYDATHTCLDWSANHSHQWSQASSASATPTSYFTGTSSYSSRRLNHTPPPPSLRLPEKPSVRYDRRLISPEAPIPPAIDKSSYSSKRSNHTTPPPSLCLAKKISARHDRRLASPEASPTPPAIHESPLTVGFSSNSSKIIPGDEREPDLARCDSILKEIQRLQNSADTKSLDNLTMFEGINAREYAYIERKQEDELEWIGARAAYFHDLQKFIVTMPSDMHEAPLEHIGFSLKSAVTSMPLLFGDYNVKIRYHHNTLVRGKNGNMIPDIHLTISGGGGDDPYLKIPRQFLFIECAFTETEAHAKEKLRNLIADHPNTIGAMMIKISEVRHPLPSAKSTIAEAHIGELVSEERWLPFFGRDNSLSASYKGVQLLDVASVDLFVWMRDSDADTPIDLDNHDSNVYAEGILHPQRSTSAVDNLLGKMMLEVKALASTYAQRIATPHSPPSSTPDAPDSPPSNTSAAPHLRAASSGPLSDEASLSLQKQGVQNWLKTIRDWSPPEPLFSWNEVTAALEEAVIGISRHRYAKWHGSLPKRSRAPSESDDDSGPTDIVGSSSASRKRAHVGG